MRTSSGATFGMRAHDTRRPRVLALGGIALAQLLAGAAYGQACNGGANPTPPSVANVNVSGTKYTPQAPLNDGLTGAVGCDGGNGGYNENGGNGSPGVPGPSFTASYSDVTVTGVFDSFRPVTAMVTADGGAGGRGGDSGAVASSSVIPGNGGAGGNGGRVAVTFGGDITPATSSDELDGALGIYAIGGLGGNGGNSSDQGIYIKAGGTGGDGGNGGAAALTVTGGNLVADEGVEVLAYGGRAGAGGDAPTFDILDKVIGGTGGNGGNGGGATATIDVGVSITSGTVAVAADASGGDGFGGGSAHADGTVEPAEAAGGAGGVGGTGGTATVSFAGTAEQSIDSRNPLVVSVVSATANGGDGGDGGQANGGLNEGGGSGGAAGAGGTATLSFTGSVTASAPAEAAMPMGQGLLAQASGGFGGYGAQASSFSGYGGNGGAAGDGGSATLNLGTTSTGGTVTTTGPNLHGAVAQSVGGGGGNGGGGAGFATSGGAGAKGGDGGNVTVAAPDVEILTNGDTSKAIIAQSVGGGGGIGGDSDEIAVGASVAIGGNGGFGGNGAAVGVTIGASTILGTLSEQGGGGVLAQSIGGAGGSGGTATSKGVGFFALTIGGGGGTGGTASTATIDSAGLVTTWGDNAAGLQAQSVGGGGGNGGVGVAKIGGIVPTTAVSVGGTGATGGTADLAKVTNEGQVSTYGSDSVGLKAQSIGGGGGSGGTAAATAISVSVSEDAPAVSVSFAAGGAGGSGNTGGQATVTNSGIVTTAGHSAFGALAQSVGGGGGTAGDASAASWTGGGEDTTVDINVSVALGGRGGTGGDAGAAGATNSGLIYTVGQDAHGLCGPSVGGGGGSGGAGDSASTSVLAAGNVGVAIGVGGAGAGGGKGGEVTVGNSGSIGTTGDAADGVFGQSVGGGGGDAGGGVSANSGGKVSVAVSVGGDGGAGGDGGTVTGGNNGVIATLGTSAYGLAGQSVGGGGGRGGKAGATAGGADDDLPLFVSDQISNGFGVAGGVTKVTDQIFLLNDRIKGDVNTLETLREKITGEVQDAKNPKNFSPEIDVAIAVGGKGGSAGTGGAVTLANGGGIATSGAQADGVIGQSVGGGGGVGGASSASGGATDDTNYELNLSLGGTGGAAGNGGTVSLTNTGQVETAGVSAYGLVSQSVGGGGGAGGASGDGFTSGSNPPSALSFGVSMGGAGGATGNGGPVSVTSSGTVATSGKHAVGILAQSVGGGGGLVRTMTTDQQGDQSASTTSDDPDTHNIFLDFGQAGAAGASGEGGQATVSLTGGTVTTSGRNAHGAVAASIGGGGGAVGGGVVNLIQRAAGAGASSGDASGAEVNLKNATIDVSGPGAVGAWAASIGGGGTLMMTDGKDDAVSDASGTGNAGLASVTLMSSHVTSTTGPAVIAHSIAGGGVSPRDGGAGSADSSTGFFNPLSFFGLGVASDAVVAVIGSTVTAGDAPAIVAKTAADTMHGGDGGTTAKGYVNIQSQSIVTNSSTTHPTIWIENIGTALDVVSVSGSTVQNTVAGGYAIFNGYDSPGLKLTNTGTIIGNIHTNQSAPGSLVSNGRKGVLAPYDKLELGDGTLRNAGTIEPGGVGRIHATELDGDLVQTATGVVRFDLASVAGKVDTLHVTGTAELAGGLTFAPKTLLPGSHEVLVADGGVTFADSLSAGKTQVFRFTPALAGNRVSLSTEADFAAGGAESDDRSSVANHLRRIWDAGGDGFATGFATLASVADGDAAGYADALDAMAGQSVAAIGYARYLGSQSFAQSTYSCPRFEDASVARTEQACGWLRVRGSWLTRDASGDDPGFDLDAVTTSIGGQARVGDGLFLGGAFGWESSRLNDDANATSVDGDSYLGAVSLKRETGPWMLTGAVDLGWGDYDSTRDIAIGATSRTANGSPDAFTAGAHLRAAYQIPRGDWYLEPAVDVDLVYVNLGGYTESGAGDLDLAVDSADTVVLAGTPWLKLGRRVDLTGGGTLDAFVSGGVSLSTGEDFTTTARFADAPAGTGDFTTELDNPNVIGRVSAGVDLYATDLLGLRLQYDGGFTDGQTSNGGQFRLSYFF